jgi:FkbM family methyltransferase
MTLTRTDRSYEPSTAKRVIYDLGANNGDDVSYYLKKADLVVAVEANPTLVEGLRQRFAHELAAGRLVVLNCVLTLARSDQKASFWISTKHHVLSQFPTPVDSQRHLFHEVKLPQRKASDVIQEFGAPYYVKIDLEGFDHEVLLDLFAAGIRPDFISAESHSIEVFSRLVLAGYRSFNLVDGETVDRRYGQHAIRTAAGTEVHSFPYHSAGPFGEDIETPWLTAGDFFPFLANEQLGWKDIHATNLIQPLDRFDFTPRVSFSNHLKDLMPSVVRAVKRRIAERRLWNL